MISIDEAVGDKAPNKPVDVIKIQNLINNNDRFSGLSQVLAVNGVSDPTLVQAIKTYQQTHPSIQAKKPDGKVSPGGVTLKQLRLYFNRSGVCRDYLPRGFGSNRLANFSVDRFVNLYGRQYPQQTLSAASAVGLDFVLRKLIADADITDIRWAAYMLATVKHECAHKWLPIEEYGKGVGKTYGNPVAVNVDAKTTVNNTYYGRGYVQLTWDYNYKAMDTALGLAKEKSLLLHPANALEPETAYRIMSHGMRHGTFTGRKLSDYIEGGKLDYFTARRIINGLDEADRIQGYAQKIEFLLRFCNGVAQAQ